MAGSRKGERRGNANPDHIRKTATPPRVRTPKVKAVAVAPLEPGLARVLRRKRTPEQMEKAIEMYFLVTGKRTSMPKDALLRAMRYFEESAVTYSEVLKANLMAASQAKTPAEREAYEVAVSAAEGAVDKYVSMTADVAMKAAPYFHPRLAAIMTGQANDKDAGTLFDMLMRDLDEAGRPARYIDHDENGVAK